MSEIWEEENQKLEWGESPEILDGIPIKANLADIASHLNVTEGDLSSLKGQGPLVETKRVLQANAVAVFKTTLEVATRELYNQEINTAVDAFR